MSIQNDVEKLYRSDLEKQRQKQKKKKKKKQHRVFWFFIKVSGSTYIIDERVVDLKSLVSTVKLMSDNVIVRITDDNATKNAMDELKKALTDDGREFTETVLDNSALDNSMADTTSEAVR